MFIKETIVYFVEGKTQNTDNDSPVWVPDSEATLCMHCKKSQFTLINRRVSKQTDVLSNSYFDIEWGLRKIHGDFEAFQIFGLKYIMKWWLRCIQIHIYGTKDIDNMIQLYMNRSEQHKVQKASKDTHRKV